MSVTSMRDHRSRGQFSSEYYIARVQIEFAKVTGLFDTNLDLRRAFLQM